MINLSYNSSKIVPCLHLTLSRFVLICHFRQDLELPHFDSLDERGLKFSLLVCNEATYSSNYVTNLLKLTLEKNGCGLVRSSFRADEVCGQCMQCKLKVNGIWMPKTDMALNIKWLPSNDWKNRHWCQWLLKVNINKAKSICVLPCVLMLFCDQRDFIKRPKLLKIHPASDASIISKRREVFLITCITMAAEMNTLFIRKK